MPKDKDTEYVYESASESESDSEPEDEPEIVVIPDTIPENPGATLVQRCMMTDKRFIDDRGVSRKKRDTDYTRRIQKKTQYARYAAKKRKNRELKKCAEAIFKHEQKRKKNNLLPDYDTYIKLNKQAFMECLRIDDLDEFCRKVEERLNELIKEYAQK